MKELKRILGLCLVCLASAGLFAACGDDAAETCESDADCATGEACLADGTCALVCTSDAECPGSETCQVLEGDPEGRSVCFTPAGGGGCTTDANCAAGEACLDDGSCALVCTSDAECASDETCQVLEGDDQGRSVCFTAPETESYLFMEIQDATNPDTTECTTGSDPGSDVFAIDVFDDTGAQVGYGAGVGLAQGVGAENNANTFYTVVDSETPAGFCDTPENNEFSADTVVSLGCGGSLFVEFLSIDDGTPLPVEPGWTVIVHEFGAQCTANATDESQSVWLCPADTSRDALTGTEPTADCTSGPFLGGGTGGEITFNDISF